MRVLSTAAVSLTVCLTLFGCGQNQTQTQAPVAAVAPPPACNCQPAQVAQAAAPVAHRHRRHHHAWSESASYGESSSSYSDSAPYGETSSSYSESSSSSVREYRPGDEDHYAGGAEEHMTQTASASAGVWVDGYGRAHYRDYGPLDDEHPGLISRKDERLRMRPWRGYDSDCDNRTD
ncbi:MAG TPA: hypothetical protein VMF58_09020 [Rhizomicrobium sp.]|nr:hypothetical protein [Rhizomicrobium sp.]